MTKHEPIAVIGMACRFPGGCTNADDFWRLLLSNTDAITEIGNERWSKEFYFHPDKHVSGKTCTVAAGQLDNVYHFEPEFFGISPREAAQMDPQQRLLLQMTWEALEDSGQVPDEIAGSDCSVYVGISSLDYANNRMDDPNVADGYFMTGNTLSIAANRISYQFDLHGPSMAIDTACSSSLVALHRACHSIWSGESSTSIIGAVHLLLSPFPFIGFSKASMLSPDGKCKVFDADANGYVRSEGGAVLLLKPLAQAEKENDSIHAVIKATAVNSDGHNAALTIPNGAAQTRLLSKVYAQANIDANEIDYIEAHGTGTAVGDPVEAASIGEGIGSRRREDNPIRIGSVKSNIGHLEPASGIAGLMKVILSLKNKTVPATIHFKQPNPAIDLAGLNLKIVDKTVTLEHKQGPLLMGVNSFGFGGSNAHAVLAEYDLAPAKPAKPAKPVAHSERITALLLSANSPVSLKKRAAQFVQLFTTVSTEQERYDICYSAAMHRQHMQYAAIFPGESIDSLTQTLQEFSAGIDSARVNTGQKIADLSEAVFVFSGNGCQWQGMGKGLMENTVFNREIEKIDAEFMPQSGWSIANALRCCSEERGIERTEIAQPLLFALQAGIFCMLAEQGISPAAVVAHSVGEVAAAYCSGVLTLKDAVRLIYVRSQAQALTCAEGKMAVANISSERASELVQQLNLTIEIAAINTAHSISVSGDEADIDIFVHALHAQRVFCKKLDINYPFHHSKLDRVRPVFMDDMGAIAGKNVSIDFFSTVTGARIHTAEMDTEYWWDNVRQPVLFHSAVKRLIEAGHRVFIEIGAHPVLGGYLNTCLQTENLQAKVIASLKRGEKEACVAIQNAVSQVIIAGNKTALQKMFSRPGKRVALPTYPWDQKTYSFTGTTDAVNRYKDHPLLGHRHNTIDYTWENVIDTQTQPWLAEHVIDGMIVFPAAAYVEMARAAAVVRFDRAVNEMIDFTIEQALLLDADSCKEVQFFLNPADNRFVIKSRNRLSASDWIMNATGRLLRSATEVSQQQDVEKLLNSAKDEIAQDMLYSLAQTKGLVYGDTFQGVQRVWMLDNKILSQLDVSHIGLAAGKHTGEHTGKQHEVLTVLLDSAFHSLMPLLYKNSTETYVPVSIRHFTAYENIENAEYCLCAVDAALEHSVTASFKLLSRTGTMLAALSGCRFQKIPTKASGAEEVQLYRYRYIPENYTRVDRISPLLPAEKFSEQLAGMTHELDTAVQENVFEQTVLPLFEALSYNIAAYTISTLSQGLDEFSIDELIYHADIAAEHRHFIAYLLTILSGDGVLSYRDGKYTVAKQQQDLETAESIWRSLLSDYPYYVASLRTLNRDVFALATKLKNKEIPLTQPETQPETQPALLCESTTHADLLNRVLSLINETWPGDKSRLRMLLLPGTGGEMATALQTIAHEAYVEIEILTPDDATRIRAERLFAQHSNVQVMQTDITDKELHQHYKQSQFDVVLATYSLYQSNDLDDAFRNIRWLLAAGGIFVLLEARNNVATNLMNGLDPAWWSRTSQQGQTAAKQLDSVEWISLIKESGFRWVENILPACKHDFLIIARQHAAFMEKKLGQTQQSAAYSIITGEDACSIKTAENIEKELSQHGIHSSRLPINDFLQEQITHSDKVIYLADLNLTRDSIAAEPDNSADKLLRLSTVARHLHAIEADKGKQLWLISQATWVSDHSNLSQAFSWGFAQVVRNEFPDIDTRQLDMQIGMSTAEIANNIVAEILNDDDEEAILFYKDTRKVIRLHAEKTAGGRIKLTQLPEDCMVVLDRSTTARHHTYQWQECNRKQPGVEEVEVKVHCTGLNFRDIMLASGLLPADMFESGFAGAGLGLDFSGVVVAKGEHVHNFEIGDEVFGFAPSSFASHVITPADAITYKPQEWTFSAAAATPTAFFTIYYALHHLARLQQGERVLIHGATGAVGLAAIQYAYHCGAEIYVTAGSEEKRDFLRSLGIEHIFDSRSLEFAEQILDISNGEGVDVILNSISHDAIAKNFSILKPFGRFLELGKRDFHENTNIDLRPFKNNISYFGIDADQLIRLQPHLTKQLFAEIMQLFHKGVFRPVAHQLFKGEQIEEAISYMQQAKHIGKVVISAPTEGTLVSQAEADVEVRLDENASYLITGGLRGFGLRTAAWLIARGAKHLVLAGLTGKVDAEAREVIKKYSAQGAIIEQVQCDVSHYAEVESMIENINASGFPLRGIVHAAMAMDDATIPNLNAANISRVLKPKAHGAWNLHLATLAVPLDHFILYSSATTCIGNPGQTSYVAANTFLQALAEYRQTLNLPATAIAWDAIIDTGFLARHEALKQRVTHTLGIKGISSTEALSLLDKILTAGLANTVVIRPDWVKMKHSLPIAQSPLFTEVMHNIHEYQEFSQAKDIRILLQSLDENEKLVFILKLLVSELSRILHIPEEKIEHHIPMQDLGVDSLMAMELASSLQLLLEINTPVMMLIDNISLHSLANRLLKMLSNATSADESCPTENAISTLATIHAEDISEDVVKEISDTLHNESFSDRKLIQ